MTLLRLRVRHALELLLALQGTVATHRPKARFGGLWRKIFVTKFFWHMSAKIIKLDDTWKLVAHSKRVTY